MGFWRNLTDVVKAAGFSVGAIVAVSVVATSFECMYWDAITTARVYGIRWIAALVN